MEELHEAAIAYYNNVSKEQQNLSRQFFQAMDIDGKGHVCLQEYTDFLRRTAGLAWANPDMFRELDRNGDGQLDFWEVLTLYYVARTRTVSCSTCLRPLNGLYFTCVTCFDSHHTFDLCVGCYKQRKYSHEHSLFLDSYVMLLSKRNHQPLPLQPLSDQNLEDQNLEDQNKVQPIPERIGRHNALIALEVAVSVATVSTLCNIM